MLLVFCGFLSALAVLILSILSGPYVVDYQSRLAGPHPTTNQPQVIVGTYKTSDAAVGSWFSRDETQGQTTNYPVSWFSRDETQGQTTNYPVSWFSRDETQGQTTSFPLGFPTQVLSSAAVVPSKLGEAWGMLADHGFLALAAAAGVSLAIAYVSVTKLGLYKRDMYDEDEEAVEMQEVLVEETPVVPCKKCRFGDLEVRDIITEGQFGTVYRVKHKVNGQACVLKEIDKTAIDRLHAHKFPADHYRQLDVLELSKDCIYCAKLITCAETKDFLYIAMPYHGRDLSWLIYHCKGVLEESVMCIITAQLSCALEFLHLRNVIHSYVTPDNIYLSDNIHAYLGNFSRSIIRAKNTKKGRWGYIGSYPYTAPEIPHGENYDEGIDWWNLGVINYLALFASPPFSRNGEDVGQMQTRLLNDDPEFPKQFNVSAAAKDFLKKILLKNSDERLGSVHSPHGSVFDQKYFRANQVVFTESDGNRIVAPTAIPLQKKELLQMN